MRVGLILGSDRTRIIFDGFTEHEPFYFKSYDKIIGRATNIHQLWMEIERLTTEDPNALEYHLKEGHIVQWLECSNEKGLASELRGVKNAKEARSKVASYLQVKRRRIGNKPERAKL
jgi:hypothetical protein